MKQPISPSRTGKLRSAMLALGVLALAAGAVAPAYAQGDEGRRGHWREGREHRGDRDWSGGVYFGPSYGYYGPSYYGPTYGYYGYPPPVVYPQPSFGITIPLDIR